MATKSRSARQPNKPTEQSAAIELDPGLEADSRQIDPQSHNNAVPEASASPSPGSAPGKMAREWADFYSEVERYWKE